MIKTGIVSATFRGLAAEDIIDLAAAAGLTGIEWSSDVHLLPGDKARARQVKKLCLERQLGICGYASYYRLGENTDPLSAFAPVLETAKELEAQVIRIWAGTQPSKNISPEELHHLTREAVLLVSAAHNIGAEISFEYHQNTLADSPEAALKLLTLVPGSRTHWQTAANGEEEENLRAIRELSSYITTVHVQQCMDGVYYPLSDGWEAWSNYMTEITKLPGDHYACLEFVKGGTAAQFLEDSKTLSGLIRRAEQGGGMNG